jgi:predicted hydrocarbon binding protein
MSAFEDLKSRLELTSDNRLMLEGVDMVLMPMWFFSGVMQKVIEEVGIEAASGIYYKTGYDGAYAWGKVQAERGLDGRRIMEQYLGSMSTRGWGRFEIIDFKEGLGEGVFRFYNATLALQSGTKKERVCLWAPGAMAGAFQVILDHAQSDLKVRGFERKCLAEGNPHCEFIVEPIIP